MSHPPKPISEIQLYYSPSQAAEIAGVSVRTMWTWMSRKYDPLPAAKINHRRLIRISDLEKWIAAQIPAPQYEKDEIKDVVERVLLEIKKKKN